MTTAKPMQISMKSPMNSPMMHTNQSVARAIHPNEDSPRIASLPAESMRPAWLATLARIPGDGLKGAGFPRNVLGTIMHNPDTFGPFLEFWVSAKSSMSLSVREQELVILRMAVLYASDYVWKHHVLVGREFGVTDAELDMLESGEFAHFASMRERALLALTDELVENRTIQRGAWDTFAHELDERALVDLVSLVSQYVFFALMNNAFQVAIEPALEKVRGLSRA
jgi:alkylhydroperoxidase family enzyme